MSTRKYTNDLSYSVRSKPDRYKQPARLSVDSCILVELCRRNSTRVLVHLTAVILMYAACGVYLISWRTLLPLRVGLYLLEAIILVGFTSIIHECIHGLFSRSKAVNRIVGTVCAAVLLKNYSLHRSFHLRHHAETGGGDDPEPRSDLRNMRDYLRLASRRGNIVFTTYVSLSGAWRAALGRLPSYCESADLRRIRIDAVVQCGWLGVVIMCLVFHPRSTFAIYIAPLCVSALLSFLVFLPEHYATKLQSRAANENTRSIRSNAMFRFVFWNNNFHAEHHAFPGVPFFQLPRLSRHMQPTIVYHASSYSQFHWQLLRQLFNNRHTNRRHKR